MDRFYHFGENPDTGNYGRILENAYMQNHSFFLDYLTRAEKAHPVLEVLWHQ
jgi:hypothetical protein